MEYEEARRRLHSDQWRARFNLRSGQLGRNPIEELTWLEGRRRSPASLPADFFEVWFAIAQETRRRADFHEYILIRELHVERGKSWAEVARAIGTGLTRQALQQRWTRLSATHAPITAAKPERS